MINTLRDDSPSVLGADEVLVAANRSIGSISQRVVRLPLCRDDRDRGCESIVVVKIDICKPCPHFKCQTNMLPSTAAS